VAERTVGVVLVQFLNVLLEQEVDRRQVTLLTATQEASQLKPDFTGKHNPVSQSQMAQNTSLSGKRGRTTPTCQTTSSQSHRYYDQSKFKNFIRDQSGLYLKTKLLSEFETNGRS